MISDILVHCSSPLRTDENTISSEIRLKDENENKKWWWRILKSRLLGDIFALRHNTIQHWKNTVSDNGYACYQVPCADKLVEKFHKNVLIMYMTTEGCITREHGLYSIIDVEKVVHKWIDDRSGAQKQMNVYNITMKRKCNVPFEDDLFSKVVEKVDAAGPERSRAEAKHHNLLRNIVGDLSLSTGNEWQVTHEMQMFRSGLFTYTPDFVLFEKAAGGGRRFAIESKTTFYGFKARDVKKKIELLVSNGYVVIGMYNESGRAGKNRTYFVIFTSGDDYEAFVGPSSFPVYEFGEFSLIVSQFQRSVSRHCMN